MIYSFVVSFASGIALEKIFGFGWSVGVLVFLISLILFFYFRRACPNDAVGRDNFLVGKIILVIGIAFCLGVMRMNFTNTSPDRELSKLVGQKIYFEAVVSDEPDVRDASIRYTTKPNFLKECVSGGLARLDGASTRNFSAEKYPCPQKYIPEKSLVLLIADRFPQFEYGDKISVSGKLDLPENFQSDNGTEFDYVSYLSKDKIHFVIYHPQIEKLAGGEGNKIIYFLYSLKNYFIDKISRVVPEPNSSLLGGLIFGTKQSLGQNLLDDFRKVGLIHIVVLSGYNITIIAAGIFYATSFLNRRKLSFLLSVIFIVLFALMVGLGATVVRACIMALIAILARFLGRPNDALRWLFIAGFLMFLWNPVILLYDPSFQLSFMATLGLILFSPFILSFISRYKFQKFIPTNLGLREIVSSTLAVQFFVLPLLIRMSGFASIISFVVNPIVLPLVPWAMAFGALTGALGSVLLFGSILSWPFGIISYFITQIIIGVTEFSAHIPFATVQTGSISLWIIFVWYLGYAFLYKKLKRNSLT